ncbi:uncharacterized protein METZ01_LOCUS472864, partial [marine metagenome]
AAVPGKRSMTHRYVEITDLEYTREPLFTGKRPFQMKTHSAHFPL